MKLTNTILPADPVKCWRVCRYGASGKCTHPEARHGVTAEAMREWGMPCGPEASLMEFVSNPQRPQTARRHVVQPLTP